MGITLGVGILIGYYFLNLIAGAFLIGKPREPYTAGTYTSQLIIWIALILAVIFL